MDFKINICEKRLARYRAKVEKLDICPSKKDEMIMLVVRMMQAFVNAAFGDDSVQIAQRLRLSDSFQEASVHANMPFIDLVDRHSFIDAEVVDLDDDKATKGANIVPPNKEENAP